MTLVVTHAQVAGTGADPDAIVDGADWDANHTLAGQASLAQGGTGSDLSATGGTGQVLKQDSAGAVVTVGTVAASEIASPAALTKTDDTNVTLTLGGTPTTALLRATSLTLGWTGTLASGRLNSNVVQSVVNDTNVTGSISAQALTLGWTGTLAAARLNSSVVQAITNDTNITGSITAQNLTLGWTGTLAETRGGTGQSTYAQGDLLYSSASNTLAKLAKNTTATRYLSNTGTSNNPAWAQVDLSNGVTGTLVVSNGGSGVASATAYAVLCGGTTSTGAFQSIASVGTSGHVLTSNGAGALPTFQAAVGGSGGGAAFNNRLINPNGQVWQRQNTGAAAITDDTYVFDRWYGLTQSAGVTASQVTLAEDGTPYMMRLSQANASAQRFGIAQIIEYLHCVDMRAQGVVLSARVRMSATTTLRYAILEWTGTSDSVTSDFVLDWTNGTFTAGNFFTTTSTTVTSTGSTSLTANTLTNISLTGTVSSSANNVVVIFWTDSTQAQNVTLDIAKVQLEIGSTASTFSPRSYVDDYHMCMRYYQKSFTYATAPAQNLTIFDGAVVTVTATTSAGSGAETIKFIPPMRASPTVTTYNTNAADANWWDANASASRTVASANTTEKGMRLVVNAVTSAGAQHFIQWQAVSEL